MTGAEVHQKDGTCQTWPVRLTVPATVPLDPDPVYRAAGAANTQEFC